MFKKRCPFLLVATALARYRALLVRGIFMSSASQQRPRNRLIWPASKAAVFAGAVFALIASPSSRTLGQGNVAHVDGGLRATLDAMAVDLVGGR